eukprot:101388_1
MAEIKDWNFQHILCDTMWHVSKHSTLDTDIVQVICEYAFHINLHWWTKHAMQCDQFVMQDIHNEEIQETINEFLNFEAYQLKEFADQICAETDCTCEYPRGSNCGQVFEENLHNLDAEFGFEWSDAEFGFEENLHMEYGTVEHLELMPKTLSVTPLAPYDNP